MKKIIGIGTILCAIAILGVGCNVQVNPAKKNLDTNKNTNTETMVNTDADANANVNANVNANTPIKTGNDDIEIDNIKANDAVSFPLTISGSAKGTWFFEADFPITVVDAKGTKIAAAIARATEDWMTTDFIGFTATAADTLAVPASETGEIIFAKSNPSGLPENNAEYRLPIKFADKYLTVGVFFPNKNDKKNTDCRLVNKLSRIIVATKAMARASLEQLIAGPTAEEKTQGSFSNINPATKIQKLYIENGAAYADFSADLEKGVAGSCNVTTIRSQIESTLLQFNTIKKVVISIDGRTEDILQP